jgi:hypothetical protein
MASTRQCEGFLAFVRRASLAASRLRARKYGAREALIGAGAMLAAAPLVRSASAATKKNVEDVPRS